MASIDQAATRQAAERVPAGAAGGALFAGASAEGAAQASPECFAEAPVLERLLDRETAERIARDPALERVFRLGYQCGRKAPNGSPHPAGGPAPGIQERPGSLGGVTYEMRTGCGPLYVTINESDDGPFELFTTMGKAGGCAASQCEAIGRMISMAWRSGIAPTPVIRQLTGISCHQPGGVGEEKVLSCADAVARAVEAHLSSR